MGLQVKLYLEYKLWAVTRALRVSIKQLHRIKTWQVLYSAMILGFLIAAILNNIIYLGFTVFAMTVYSVIAVYRDIISGKHVHWARQRLKERMKSE